MFEKMEFLKLILLGFICLLPILGWLWFFQRKQPEKKIFVILTFIAGMAAIIPIKLYEKYWHTAIGYFEHLNLFLYLSELVNTPSLTKLLSFISVHTIVAIGLFLFAAVLMFILEVFSGDNSVRLFRQKTVKIIESPAFFIIIGVLCGVVAFFASMSLPEKIWFFLVVGMLEEFIKHLVLRFADDEKIFSVDDALEYSIIVALGFVFVENIFYLDKILSGSPTTLIFVLFIILRSSISVIAHVCFSAIFGYFYGIAHFSNEFYLQEQQAGKHPIIHKLHQILHLRGATIFHEEKMLEGMLLAMIFHAVFNSLLEYDKLSIVIPLIIILFIFVVTLFQERQFDKNKNHFLSSIKSKSNKYKEYIPHNS